MTAEFARVVVLVEMAAVARTTNTLVEHPEPRARSARGGECAMQTPQKKIQLSKTSKTCLERVN